MNGSRKAIRVRIRTSVTPTPEAAARPPQIPPAMRSGPRRKLVRRMASKNDLMPARYAPALKVRIREVPDLARSGSGRRRRLGAYAEAHGTEHGQDRKSTRLNSSHVSTS